MTSQTCGRACWLKLATTQEPAIRRQQTVDVPLPESVAAENAHKLYQSLHPWQTRIIDLHPGKPGHQVECDLLVVDLIAENGVGVPARSKIIYYEALSYSWGWPALTSTIFCNGIRHGVPPGLFEALTYLRYEHDHRFLWADALVVNQHDDVEKASQVQKMLMIFEKAQRVVAWLGTATMETDVLFSIMVAQTVRFGLPNADDESHSQHQERTVDIERDIGGLALDPNVHDAECVEAIRKMQKAVATFFRRRWFHRTWIRQEVFSAANLLICCGSFAIEYHQLLSFLEDLTRSQPQSSILSNAQGFRIFREDAYHAGTTSSGYRPPRKQKAYALHWLTTLQKGSFLGVTDERDRIFGSLGLLQSAATRSYVSKPRSCRQIDPFPVDYQWTLSETFQYCVKYLINADRDLRALIVFEDRRNQSSDLPSWTVDWRQCQPRFFGFESPDSLRNEFYKLRTTFEGSKAAYQDLDCIGKLVLQGSIIEMSLALGQTHVGENWNGKIYGVPKIDSSTSSEPTLSIGQVLTLLLVSGAYVSRGIAFGGTGYYWNEALVPATAVPGDVFVWFESTNCITLLRPCDCGEYGRSYTFVGPIALIRPTGIGTTVSIRFSLDLVASKEELRLTRRLDGPVQSFTLQ